MGFYNEIAKYYDDIFSTGEAQVAFLKEVIGSPPKEVLDIACGTGGYSIPLAQQGHHLSSVDLDHEMIQTLKSKVERLQIQLEAIQGNMLNLDNKGKKYDAAFCIGNSIVHLQSIEEIAQFIKNVKNVLKKNGKFILQIINYDRILKYHVKSLPTIENKNIPLSFERLYDYQQENNKVNFKTILRVEGKEIQNEIPLYPLLSGELLDILDSLGFYPISLYGDFNKTKYDKDDSFLTVLVASVWN
ncbi:MAG: class I SAM-dependent methyltransferase [Eubacteriales bacterium]